MDKLVHNRIVVVAVFPVFMVAITELYVCGGMCMTSLLQLLCHV